MRAFDATLLYANGMCDGNSVHPKLESGFAFKPHLNDLYVKFSSDQFFNEDGDESAILKKKFYSPPIFMFQHIPVKEKTK